MSLPRLGRENALRMLFQWEMTKDPPEKVKESYRRTTTKEQPGVDLGEKLFDAVVARVEEIDKLLREHAQRWSLERMSAVDRNILRLGVCEFLTRSDLSAHIIIDEAVEVAKQYSTDQAAHFINGVLDAVGKQLRAKDPAPVTPAADTPER